MRRWFLLILGCVLTNLLAVASPKEGFSGDRPALYLREHEITIDATKLVPTSWWQVPGVTPSIWNSDPESLDAPKTSERRELRLKPGKYKFISFTFDFPFTVNLNGTLDFSKSLDQCGGQRDAYYDQKPNDG
jgi:hypothetical protein